MKAFSSFASIAAICILTESAFAGNPPPEKPTKPQWTVRIEALVVDLPQDKALALLPSLRDPDKIEGATSEILADIDRKEATLAGYPVLEGVEGVLNTTEDNFEWRYPTEYNPPDESQIFGPVGGKAALPNSIEPPTPKVATPTAFETRNLGVHLEATADVLHNGDSILLAIHSSHVIYVKDTSFTAGITQPQFASLNVVSTTAVRNGQRILLAVHKSPHVENQMEFVILQAVAKPLK